MPFSITWDEAYPAGTDASAGIDTYIQEDKTAVRERLESLLGIANFSVRDPMSADALKMNGAASTKILGGTATWIVADSTGATPRFTVDTTNGALTTGTVNGQTISATASFTGTLNVVGNFSVNTNKLTVDATTGNTLVAGTLSVTGDVAVNTNKFTVTASSGNTLVAGTLSVTGDVAVNTNKFTVTASSGNTLVAGTLSVTSDFAINTNKFAVTASSGNTSIAGTVSITETASATPLSFTDANIAGSRTVTLKNTNTGTTGYAGIAIGNSTTNVVLNQFSTGYTTSGTNLAAGAALVGYGVGGLSVGAGHASGVLRLYSQNVLAATFTGTATSLAGTLSAGATTLTGKLSTSFSGGGDYVAYFRNTSNTTPYTVQIQEPATASAGYALLMINSSGGTAWFNVNSGGAAAFGSTLAITGTVGVGGAAVSTTTALATPAGTTGVSSLRVPHGAAPTSPVDGDIWTDTSGIYVRINGVTKTFTLT